MEMRYVRIEDLVAKLVVSIFVDEKTCSHKMMSSIVLAECTSKAKTRWVMTVWMMSIPPVEL